MENGDWIALRTSPLGRFRFFTDKPLERATLGEAFPFLKKSIVLQQRLAAQVPDEIAPRKPK
jgi:hypothetical protein